MHFSFSTKLTPDLYLPLISEIIYLHDIRNVTPHERQPAGRLPLQSTNPI